jgi:N-acetylglucosamine-6-phosphate deacetylase
VKKVFKARTLFSPDGTVDQAVLVVEDGVISAVGSQAGMDLPGGGVVDFGEAALAPAYFDQHIHGGGGFDAMEATDEALSGVGRFLAAHGVAGYLATTVTASVEATLASLSGLARLIRQDKLIGREARAGEAAPVGIHLEGPFLSHEKRGVHPPELLLTPTVALFDRFWEAAEGKIRLMTIAPELPNAEEVIAHATQLGVRVSIGHSNATAEPARSGIAAGAVTATHTFNAMRSFSQREPGILGVVLDDENLYAEIISDGFHVDPSAVRLFWKAKGAERAILVTDGMSATGMPDGMYKLGELDVEVKDGKCLHDGVIAGSTLTMDVAVSNFREFTGAGLDAAVGLAARNPARMLGLDGRFGSLAVGRRADFVVLGEDGVLRQTVLGGELLAL